MKLEAIKDGEGNIIISKDSFEMLLSCLDNQKFIGESPQNGDSLSVGEERYNKTQTEIQNLIDEYNKKCRKILHQKYAFGTMHEGLSLYKKYENQEIITKWTGEDVGKVYELFKNTLIKYKEPESLLPLDGTEVIKHGSEPIGKTEDGWVVCKAEPRPWLIERAIGFDNAYLTISEDGTNNRPWKQEEIDKIIVLFNGYKKC